VCDVTRDELHRVVDELPETRQEEALRLLEYLRDRQEFTAEAAPVDDEPLTEEDRSSLRAADADIAAGRLISNEDMKRELFGT